MTLTHDQLKNVCEASQIKSFKPGDKFVMIYKNINAEYNPADIFTIKKIEDNTLLFTKARQKKCRYFVDESQLICKI